MNISSLQKARYEYSPKLPGMLRNGISEICVQEGAETQSVADQEKIKALFPNTYGKKEITFVKGQNTSEAKTHRVGGTSAGSGSSSGTRGSRIRNGPVIPSFTGRCSGKGRRRTSGTCRCTITISCGQAARRGRCSGMC